jgi:hypothetical protein
MFNGKQGKVSTVVLLIATIVLFLLLFVLPLKVTFITPAE